MTYGSGSTTSSIATALASTLSSGTWVNASATGNVVSITAKTAGASTNYTLSAASSTNNPQGLFSGPSFSTSASGAALSGGANAFTTTQGATIYSLSMGYTPNGNILSANDSANGNWTYSYDDFNRVTGASKNNGAQTYNYVYDRYGNRWQQNAPQGGYVQLLVFNSGNNRMDGYTYDASGNLLNDGTNNFTYDAESRLIKSVRSGATTTYVYDAVGRRVRKSVAGITTDYVYNLGGTVTETNSAAAWTRAEIYAGGRHVATYAGGVSGTTYFHHADWLGTERVRSDITGAACETVTSLIFGDGQSVSGSCGDPSTRHFTGKQRDDESGLDDFGARYYSSQLGRFVSADWSGVPAPVPYANLTNPQTLNLYALVHENPVTFADLDGHVDPGQLAFSDGMGVTPRMRGGNGNAYGCLDTGCGSYITIWQLTINGVGTDQFFDSEAAGRAYIANLVEPNHGSRTLNDAERAALGPFLTQYQLDHARIHDGKPLWLTIWAKLHIGKSAEHAAVTVGNNIYFPKGEYTGHTREDFSWLAHELFHVDQYHRGDLTLLKYAEEAAKHGTTAESGNKYEKPADAYATNVSAFIYGQVTTGVRELGP